MVRLRMGRFAWELYYTQTKAVLPREEVRRRLGLIAGHLGYITALFEYIMTDMLWLRVFASIGSGLIIVYQVVQPKIQWISAGWNAIYVVMNGGHICLLLQERRVPQFSEEEASLLDVLGERLTKRQLRSVLQAGEWRSFDDGAALAHEGDVEQEVHLISTGSCDIFQGGIPVGSLGAGDVVGEVGQLAQAPRHAGSDRLDVRASATVVARGGVRCLCLPRARLQKEPELRDALQGVFAVALAAKVAALGDRWRAERYAALLHLAGVTGSTAGVAALAEAASFRREAGISDEEHGRIAEAVERATGQALPSPEAPAEKAAASASHGAHAAAELSQQRHRTRALSAETRQGASSCGTE